MKTATREFEIEARSAAQGDERTAPLVLSTTTPVDRDFGKEILDHSPSAVDLSRAPLPLLESHNTGALPVGVVEDLRLDGDKLRGKLRLSKSARAGEIWQDIQDRIIRGVSVGYQIFKTQNEADGVVRATRWQPLEASLVSIPADPRAGIFRNHEVTVMETNEIQNGERDRVSGILMIADKFSRYIPGDATRAFVSEGKSVEEFREFVLSKIGSAPALRAAPDSFDISERERRSYSIVNALRSQLPANMLEGTKVDAGYEIEISQELAKRSHKAARGILVPMEGMQKRDLVQGTAGLGGNLVATNLLVADFIQLLRNRTQVLKLGAKLLTGLVGNVAIPAQTGGATAQWATENAALAESDQAFAQLLLSPHQLGMFTKMSRRLLLQSTPGIEQIVTEDIVLQMAVAIDAAVIAGTGAGGQPTGILNTTGVGSVALGVDGGSPTYPSIIALYQAVAAANADVGALGFLTNALVKSTLLQTAKIGTTFPEFIWEDAPDPDEDDFDGMMIGYRAAVSNNVPSNLTKGTGTNLSAILFGNWNDVYIGQWNALDLIVDPYTYSSTGELAIVGWQDVDIGIRHAASFAAIVDAITV